MHQFVTHNRHYPTQKQFANAILKFFRETSPNEWKSGFIGIYSFGKSERHVLPRGERNFDMLVSLRGRDWANTGVCLSATDLTDRRPFQLTLGLTAFKAFLGSL